MFIFNLQHCTFMIKHFQALISQGYIYSNTRLSCLDAPLCTMLEFVSKPLLYHFNNKLMYILMNCKYYLLKIVQQIQLPFRVIFTVG